MARFSLDVFQIELRTGKIPLLGNISLLCIQNELVLAKFARRVSDKPRTQPFGNTLRENIARKAPFSRPRYPNHAKRAYLAILSSQTSLMPEPDCPNPSIPGGTVPPTPMALPPGIALLMPHANPAPGRLHANAEHQPSRQRTALVIPPNPVPGERHWQHPHLMPHERTASPRTPCPYKSKKATP